VACCAPVAPHSPKLLLDAQCTEWQCRRVQQIMAISRIEFQYRKRRGTSETPCTKPFILPHLTNSTFPPAPPPATATTMTLGITSTGTGTLPVTAAARPALMPQRQCPVCSIDNGTANNLKVRVGNSDLICWLEHRVARQMAAAPLPRFRTAAHTLKWRIDPTAD
jgi:hypothetical protein